MNRGRFTTLRRFAQLGTACAVVAAATACVTYTPNPDSLAVGFNKSTTFTVAELSKNDLRAGASKGATYDIRLKAETTDEGGTLEVVPTKLADARTIRYTPTHDFFGTDAFDYDLCEIATDGNTTCKSTSVTLTSSGETKLVAVASPSIRIESSTHVVLMPESAFLAGAQTFARDPGTREWVPVKVKPSDLSVTDVTRDGKVIYTPPAGFVGVQTVPYELCWTLPTAADGKTCAAGSYRVEIFDPPTTPPTSAGPATTTSSTTTSSTTTSSTTTSSTTTSSTTTSSTTTSSTTTSSTTSSTTTPPANGNVALTIDITGAWSDGIAPVITDTHGTGTITFDITNSDSVDHTIWIDADQDSVVDTGEDQLVPSGMFRSFDVSGFTPIASPYDIKCETHNDLDRVLVITA